MDDLFLCRLEYFVTRRVEIVSQCVGKRVGIMGLDLGGTSGVCWWSGVLRESVADTFAGADGGFDWKQIDCGNGTVEGERAGAVDICKLFADVSADWTLGAVPDSCQFLVMEDFMLRPRIGSTARVGLASARLAGLVEGMLVRVLPSERLYRYQAGRAKSFAPNARLKKWGLWCVGAPHSRDAARCVAVHVAQLISA